MNVKNIDAELNKPINESKYKNFPYSRQIEDLGVAHVRLIYQDGTIVEPLAKSYGTIIRKNMKSASVISESGKILFTLDIINDKLIYRIRNIIPPIQNVKLIKKIANPKYNHMYFANPKRCFVLSTEGRNVFVWDSGEITETTQWGKVEPYTKPVLMEAEK